MKIEIANNKHSDIFIKMITQQLNEILDYIDRLDLRIAFINNQESEIYKGELVYVERSRQIAIDTFVRQFNNCDKYQNESGECPILENERIVTMASKYKSIQASR